MRAGSALGNSGFACGGAQCLGGMSRTRSVLLLLLLVVVVTPYAVLSQLLEELDQQESKGMQVVIVKGSSTQLLEELH